MTVSQTPGPVGGTTAVLPRPAARLVYQETGTARPDPRPKPDRPGRRAMEPVKAAAVVETHGNVGAAGDGGTAGQ
jgi:hypothetical protein